MAMLIASEIKESFDFQKDGLEGVIAILKYYFWAIITGYQIEAKDHAVIMNFRHCYPQETRLIPKSPVKSAFLIRLSYINFIRRRDHSFSISINVNIKSIS
ncbi:MAG: hypothetical protein A2169_01985 [Deltaproteobacteria bacterium RBG_13_47_9]|nr:MAG: hypothetical protein A2169_01985 [Deltaproteobacteria bacterium RBG_13_47_9]